MSKLTDVQAAAFVLKAIPVLRDMTAKQRAAKGQEPLATKGIHTVYSGFNSAFKMACGAAAYEKESGNHPVIKALVEQGKIVITPSRGGSMMYLAGDAPVSGAGNGAKALAAIMAAAKTDGRM